MESLLVPKGPKPSSMKPISNDSITACFQTNFATWELQFKYFNELFHLKNYMRNDNSRDKIASKVFSFSSTKIINK